MLFGVEKYQNKNIKVINPHVVINLLQVTAEKWENKNLDEGL